MADPDPKKAGYPDIFGSDIRKFSFRIPDPNSVSEDFQLSASLSLVV